MKNEEIIGSQSDHVQLHLSLSALVWTSNVRIIITIININIIIIIFIIIN